MLLVFLPIILFFASFLIGRYPIDPVDVIKTILCPIFPQLEVSQTITTIVFEIRLPRIIGAFVVGAALAMAGFAFQGIFKNPLVSSDLLGVSNGAGFGAALAILLSGLNVVTQIFAFVFGLISVPIIIGVVVLMLLRWRINLLSMCDEEAQALGLNPSRTRLVVIAACTLLTSAAVSISGIIGWLGLVIPHMTRMIVGPDNKILIPASLSLGASFLLLIDNISRAVISIEIPIGILTAVIGVPIFLYLLRKGYSEWS